ncbi:anti-sigma factor antagonist [Streptosporangium becharense]|uniref:anti-sigma factor antagonist n=1 Tax=Streptosporangium becharense TaxID=1816182 RepID=UPI0021A34CAA|nr:anti-sigma factor antagonist [Streptosporangium becharense]
MEFQLRVDRRRHGMILHAGGSLDYLSSQLLKEEIDVALRTEGGRRLVIDLGGVSFCDSTGYGVLIYALTRVRAVAGSLVLAGLPTTMRERLNLLGLGELFDVRDTAEEAVTPPGGG